MSGPRVSGGGTIAVETDGMVQAAHALALCRDAIRAVIARTSACVDAMPAAPRRGHTETALALLRSAALRAEAAADGLRTAAIRYGVVEHAVLDGQRTFAAAAAALVGTALRFSIPVLGVAGPVVVATGVLELGGAFVVGRTLQRTVETGRFAPQADPVLLRALALALTSLDDAVRGTLLIERPEDAVTDDPGGPFGLERIGALLAGVALHPAGAELTVRRTTERPVRSPRSLAALVDRLPRGSEPAGQVRIERYDGPGGTRWIVYIAGTVTFARDSGDEPFDLASDVLGVAHRPSDSEAAVLLAMQQAGIGQDDPVLLVGHSQGALDAVRVAEDGGYRVGGVVGFGGPTGQVVLPGDVPVLAVEHDEDLVPELGGAAAVGAAGLRRVVVTRSLPDSGFGVATSAATAAFPAHDLGAYRRTIQQAEASGAAPVAAFTAGIGPFLDGGAGTATRWQARRVSSGPAPTAGGGTARRSSR